MSGGDKHIRIQGAAMPHHSHQLPWHHDHLFERFSPSLDEKLYDEMQKYMQEAISGSFGVPSHMLDAVPELMHRREMEKAHFGMSHRIEMMSSLECSMFSGYIPSSNNELLLLL